MCSYTACATTALGRIHGICIVLKLSATGLQVFHLNIYRIFVIFCSFFTEQILYG